MVLGAACATRPEMPRRSAYLPAARRTSPPLGTGIVSVKVATESREMITISGRGRHDVGGA